MQNSFSIHEGDRHRDPRSTANSKPTSPVSERRRDVADKLSPDTTRVIRWECHHCGLRSPQDADGFVKHVKDVHPYILEAKESLPIGEKAEFWTNLLEQAKTGANAQTRSPTTAEAEHPSDDLGRLSISLPQKLASPSLADGRVESRNRTGTLEQASITAIADTVRTQTPSRQSSPSSHIRVQQHSAHRRQVSRTTTLASDHVFERQTRESREASRESNEVAPTDVLDARRKRQSTQAQPAPPAPPPTLSPRQPLPLGRSRGILQSTDPRYPGLIREPDSRGISQEQLNSEIRAIYHVLTTLESRCIKLDKEQAIASQKGPLSPNVWRVLIGIHRRLLNDHHDFLLASHHPAASPAHHRLAAKYNMPARLWKYGIHVFLELLRHQLPHSLEFMISYVYQAYQMMGLLLETVPAFKETWIECKGDLSRYRMAIEEKDMQVRENWGAQACYWYSAAADMRPEVGRLWHHLSILARPDALKQNALFVISLIAVQPFLSTRDSILTLYEPMLKDGSPLVSPVNKACIRTSANLFLRRWNDAKATQAEFLEKLPNAITSAGPEWKSSGVHVAMITIGAVLDHGLKSTMLRAIETGIYAAKHPNDSRLDSIEAAPTQRSDNSSDKSQQSATPISHPSDSESEIVIAAADSFFFETLQVVLSQYAYPHSYTYIHVVLCFLLTLVAHHEHLYSSPELEQRSRSFLQRVPWADVCTLLGFLSEPSESKDIEVDNFPRRQQGEHGRLPEDFLLRPTVFAVTFFPDGFFDGISSDDDRAVEYPSTQQMRIDRIRWIGYQFERHGCLASDMSTGNWKPNPASPLVGSLENTRVATEMSIDTDYVVPSSVDHFSTSSVPFVQPTTGNTSPKHDRAMASTLSKETALFVLDTKVSIKHLDIFRHLTQQSWNVAVLANLPKQLRKLSKSSKDSDIDTIMEIERQVKLKGSNVRALNGEGQLVYSLHSVASELAGPVRTSETAPSSQASDDTEDWQIVHIMRRVNDLQQQPRQSPVDASDRFSSVVLVTDDDATIAHATEVGVQAVTSDYIRTTLMADKDLAVVAGDTDARLRPL